MLESKFNQTSKILFLKDNLSNRALNITNEQILKILFE